MGQKHLIQKCKKYKCHNLSHFESCLLTQHIDIIMQRHAEVSCKSVFRNFKKMQFLDSFPTPLHKKHFTHSSRGLQDLTSRLAVYVEDRIHTQNSFKKKKLCCTEILFQKRCYSKLGKWFPAIETA